MAQPDISSILAALAQNQQNPTSHAPTPQQQPTPSHGMPMAYPPPQSGGGGYLPQPSSTGSVDLSTIRPVNTGSVSIADAIAKAKSIAADRGVSSFDPRQASSTPREDPRLSGRDYGRSRSRSPSRQDQYGGNPYRDERREDPRRGSFRRSPSADRNFRGARDPPAGFKGNDSETETIRVKSSLVGLIIGRNGENMRKIETDSGARVQFLQAKDSHVSERQCTVSGSLRARESAKAAIYAIIDENGGANVMQEKGAYMAGMPGRAKVNLPALRDGERSSQIMVPDKTVGLIIGRGGETITDLQERSGCHVNIVGENKSVNGLRPVNLIGDDRATAVAKELILEIVESDSKSSGTNQGSQQRDRGFGDYGQQNSNASGGRDWVEKTIHVPSEAVGMIIGKGGETIKDMQRTTGCKINVNQPKPPDHHRDIDLAGSSRSMADAERIIWEKVETVRQRDEAAGRGGRESSGGQYSGYSQQQQQPSVPSYGQYMPTGQQTGQAPPQMPAFQMPYQQAAPAQQSTGQNASDPWAQQAMYQWYAQQMANLGQQQPPAPGNGAPGTQ